jgi:hypothetical protein
MTSDNHGKRTEIDTDLSHTPGSPVAPATSRAAATRHAHLPLSAARVTLNHSPEID